MTDISTNLVESLKTMGLTEYEAKVYSALVLFDRAEVKRIYEYLGVPKPSVYHSLKGLMDKGLVMIVSSKPAIYRAVPPKIALKYLAEIYRSAEDSALEELEDLEKSVLETESPDIIWTLFGDKNVEHSMEELISRATRTMKLVLPEEYIGFLSFIRGTELDIELIMIGKDKSLMKYYELKNLSVHDAYGLDVNDFNISKYFTDFPLPFRNYPLLPENFSILVSIDGEEFMYVPPFPGKTKSGITSKNRYLVTIVDILFGIAWQHTPEVQMDI